MADTARGRDSKRLKAKMEPSAKAAPLAKMNSISTAMDGVVNTTQPVTVSGPAGGQRARRQSGKPRRVAVIAHPAAALGAKRLRHR